MEYKDLNLNGWITIPDAAKRLGISKQAVFKRINKRCLQCIKIGSSYIVRWDALTVDDVKTDLTLIHR